MQTLSSPLLNFDTYIDMENCNGKEGLSHRPEWLC